MVAINRDAADTGHLILDINHQVQNFDVASGYWSVTPSDWFTPYQVVTESNSDEASTYFSPNDYFQFYVGTYDDDLIFGFKRNQEGELYSSLGNGAGYQEDYVVAGFGDDIIYANGGDIVHAGAGNDVIFFDYTGKEAEIHGGSGFDVVQVNGSINDYYFVANRLRTSRYLHRR